MREPPSFITVETLPAPPPGWWHYACGVLGDGALALVRTDRDMAQARGRASWEGVTLRLSRLEYGVDTDVVQAPSPPWPIVERFPDGRWLVVSARAWPSEANAILHAPDGPRLEAFAVGDAVEHVRVTPDGLVWVGYFDEHLDQALAAFDDAGRQAWGWPAGRDWPLDCYALSATENDVWACPYPGFEIWRVSGGAMTGWRNPVAGARAIAAKERHVILAGGYDEEADRVALLRLDEAAAELVSSFGAVPGANADPGRGAGDAGDARVAAGAVGPDASAQARDQP